MIPHPSASRALTGNSVLPCGPGAGGALSQQGEETARAPTSAENLLPPEVNRSAAIKLKGPGPHPASARCNPGEQTQKHPKLGRRHELTRYFIAFVANKAKPQGGAEFLVYLV